MKAILTIHIPEPIAEKHGITMEVLRESLDPVGSELSQGLPGGTTASLTVAEDGAVKHTFDEVKALVVRELEKEGFAQHHTVDSASNGRELFQSLRACGVPHAAVVPLILGAVANIPD